MKDSSHFNEILSIFSEDRSKVFEKSLISFFMFFISEDALKNFSSQVLDNIENHDSSEIELDSTTQLVNLKVALIDFSMKISLYFPLNWFNRLSIWALLIFNFILLIVIISIDPYKILPADYLILTWKDFTRNSYISIKNFSRIKYILIRIIVKF